MISYVLAKKLQSIDYNSLPISDYNKQYIHRMYDALSYYLDIYADCIYKGIASTGLSRSEITLVDYGGGSGFLSILARFIGIKEVIYIDLNPLSVETVKVLKQHIGIGPDHILPGDSNALADWCKARQIEPQLLIATDLIEHVYDLERFFGNLCGINPEMEMIFTTASTPYNPVVKRRLHRFMQDCESGTAVTPNYYTRRKNFIQEQYPNLSEEQQEVWSRFTRGLIYSDIRKSIEMNHLSFPEDKYNTCDPETGNWAERILPIHYYRNLLELYNYKLTIEKGFYNVHRKNRMMSFLFRCMNGFIRSSGRLGLFFSPYIILRCRE